MRRQVERAQREIDRAEADRPCAGRGSWGPRRRSPATPSASRSSTSPSSSSRSAAWPAVGRRTLDRAPDRAVSRDHAGEHLRPADVHPDDQVRRHDAATIPGQMPAQDKPYRVYRGGRAKGRVPLTRHTSDPRKPDSPGPGTVTANRRGNRAVRVAGSRSVSCCWSSFLSRGPWGATCLSRAVSALRTTGFRPASSGSSRSATACSSRHRRRSSSSGLTAATAPAGRAPTGPTRSCCCAPIRANGDSHTSPSRGTFRSRFPSTGSRRSTRPTSSVGPRSPCGRSRT